MDLFFSFCQKGAMNCCKLQWLTCMLKESNKEQAAHTSVSKVPFITRYFHEKTRCLKNSTCVGEVEKK